MPGTFPVVNFSTVGEDQVGNETITLFDVDWRSKSFGACGILGASPSPTRPSSNKLPLAGWLELLGFGDHLGAEALDLIELLG